MKIKILLFTIMIQLSNMETVAQKITYIHFLHGPLLGNKENDYVAIGMNSKSKDIIFYEAGKKRRRKPQNHYSRYFYTLEKDTLISYSRSSYDISVKDEKGENKYGRLPLDYMLHVEFADGTNRNFLKCPLYPIGNKNLHGRDLYWNNLRMILKYCFPRTK
ncbi:hypothetical protein [Hoylesella shahii]|jgi:hypothetical protein|uniref:Uncharacterized protein n=1 Tax=Hoylesella shahii DSM 15611 = JCM 12083 TaxID=1122991 RepID=A0A318HNM0_9BACT|nr:hypothetical protein [Hoylesella shahii]PXX15460.1 hypothetical protein EJ73_02846 [Hoylesella shahii DSM 15611 = JCM 12083]